MAYFKSRVGSGSGELSRRALQAEMSLRLRARLMATLSYPRRATEPTKRKPASLRHVSTGAVTLSSIDQVGPDGVRALHIARARPGPR
jgi:hypothetical protein